MATDDNALRKQLVALLKSGQAHTDTRTALADFPLELAGERPHGLPYSAWQLLEHMRFTVKDLLEFSTNPEYAAPKWPDDYWPKDAAPPSSTAWKQSSDALFADLDAFEKLAGDPHSNLFDTIPWADHKQTLLREILLAASHNSYHTGELIVLRRLLGAWHK